MPAIENTTSGHVTLAHASPQAILRKHLDSFDRKLLPKALRDALPQGKGWPEDLRSGLPEVATSWRPGEIKVVEPKELSTIERESLAEHVAKGSLRVVE